MTSERKKYLSEFSLPPQSTEELQKFFSENPAIFDIRDHAHSIAEKKLEALLKNMLPIDALADVFSGTADHAIAIHGLPEAEGLENSEKGKLPAERIFSYHIGNALYRILGVQPAGIDILNREKDNPGRPAGMTTHRDVVARPPKKIHSEYVIFSSPHNAENAVTQIIHLKNAIESIPESMRRDTWVDVIERQTNLFGDISRLPAERALDAVLKNLNTPVNDLNNIFIQKIALSKLSPPESPAGQAFLKAIEEHGVRYNIQPGTLVIINEGKMFHRAHKGDTKSITTPMRQTRLLLHISGRPPEIQTRG